MKRHGLPPLCLGEVEDSQSLPTTPRELPSTPAKVKVQSIGEKASTKADPFAALIAVSEDRRNSRPIYSPF